MLTSLAFFPGYTKDRLPHSLPETLGCQRCEGQGAGHSFLLTTWTYTVGRQHSYLVAAACEFLVLTFKTIRKSFLLFLLLSPLLPSSSLLSPSLFFPPPLSPAPISRLLFSPSPIQETDQPMRPHPPPGPQALRVPGQERPCVFVLCSSVEVAHSVSEGVSGSQVGMGTTASLAELPSFACAKALPMDYLHSRN